MWGSIGLQDFFLNWPEGRQRMMMDLAQTVSVFRVSTMERRTINCCEDTASRWKRMQYGAGPGRGSSWLRFSVQETDQGTLSVGGVHRWVRRGSAVRMEFCGD